MDCKGLAVKDLEPMIGKSNRAYEILKHKRALTPNIISRLDEQLNISCKSLIKRISYEYHA